MGAYRWLFGLGGLFSTCLFSSQAALPNSMGSIGDSITAGALVQFYRRDSHGPWFFARLIKPTAKLMTLQGIKGAMQVPKFNWATGLARKERVFSHAQRITRLKGQLIPTINVAESMIKIDELDEQLDRLIEKSRRNLGKNLPDYLTVLAGANDLCLDKDEEIRSVDSYKNYMDSILRKIHDMSPSTKVLLSHIPNITRLREVSKGAYLGLFGNCRAMWALHGFCDNFLLTREEHEAERLHKVLVSYNQALSDLGRGRAHWLKVATSTYNIPFGRDDIAVDCFHPDYSGQKKIADATWNQSWWANYKKEVPVALNAKPLKARRIVQKTRNALVVLPRVKEVVTEREPLRNVGQRLSGLGKKIFSKNKR